MCNIAYEELAKEIIRQLSKVTIVIKPLPVDWAQMDISRIVDALKDAI